MKEVVFASNNKHKIKEVRQILGGFKVLSLEDIGLKEDIEETGTTFLENALIKARAATEFLRTRGRSLEVIADDSGLCVEALSGAPGVFSARYAKEHNAAANRAKLLKELEGNKNRRAYFECVFVRMQPDGEFNYGVGKTHGTILEEETGDNSFGYDCLFFSDDLNKSFGKADADEKNTVSHRARAIKDCFKLGSK